MTSSKEAEKKNTLRFSVGMLLIIIVGAVVAFTMYYLIQKSFLQATRAHEMELMQIMERLGSQLMDSRLKDLKVKLEGTATQYGEELFLAAEDEKEQILSSIVLSEDGLGYCYQTLDKQYWGGQSYKDDVTKIDLTEAWAGKTVLFSPDFNEKGNYILAIATPVWQKKQEDTVGGILIEYLDGYCISRWMEDLFVSLDLGTAYIIDSEGRNIATAREENYDWITTRYNAQDLAKENGDEATQSIAQLEKLALDGENGIGTYEWEGSLSYVAYGPLVEVDWGFCVGFYGNQFEEYAREVTMISSRSAGILLAGFALFLVMLLAVIMRNLRKERRFNQLLVQQKEEIEQQAMHIAASEERFRIAMQRNRDIILECQLKTGEISCFYEDKEVRRGRIGDAALRDQLVEGYCMDEEAFGRFEAAIRAISGGLANAEGIISGDCAGEKKWYRMSITAVPNGSHRPTRAVGILRDATEERKADLDSLTRLYNKSAMTEYVKSAMHSNSSGNANAFVMMDIDCFKKINDQYGHPVGDQVLCEVAESLRTIFPEPYLAGRFGGDEFCVYCPKILDTEELDNQLTQLSKRVKGIKIKDCKDSKVSLSMGAVIFYGQAEFEEIYKKADEILYKSKKAGRDRYYIFESK